MVEQENHGSPLVWAHYQRPAPHSSHVRRGPFSHCTIGHFACAVIIPGPLYGDYPRSSIDEPMLSRHATNNNGVTANRQLYKVIQDQVGPTFCPCQRDVLVACAAY